jgi:hypothetical protein
MYYKSYGNSRFDQHTARKGAIIIKVIDKNIRLKPLAALNFRHQPLIKQTLGIDHIQPIALYMIVKYLGYEKH